MSDWTKVYDLADDKVQVGYMQEATLEREDEVGLRPEPALIGSDEWWRLLGSEALPLIAIEGVISEVYMSGHGDMPEFALRQDDGEVSRWLRSDDKAWREGRRARVEYVVQCFKKPLVGTDSAETKVVVRMWLGPDANP